MRKSVSPSVPDELTFVGRLERALCARSSRRIVRLSRLSSGPRLSAHLAGLSGGPALHAGSAAHAAWLHACPAACARRCAGAYAAPSGGLISTHGGTLGAAAWPRCGRGANARAPCAPAERPIGGL